MVLLRHKLFIDRDVQGMLLRRTALYGIACALYFTVILLLTESMSDPDESIVSALLRCLDEAIYWVPGLAILAPVVAYDILVFSNRFTGPAFRLQREMQRLVKGESERPLSFRDDDYWVEMADTFNEIRDELMELRQAKKDAAAAARAESEPALQPRLFSKDDDESDVPDQFATSNA